MPAAVSDRRSPSCCAIQHTETVEDYLKATHRLCAREGSASTSSLAGLLGVAPPSVSAMVSRLEEHHLIEHHGRGRVVLTPHGQVHALSIVRRHRLLETVLHRFLGLHWDEVHAEAEVLEHALSDRLVDRIDAVLGHPDRDPHGDPIPPKAGPHEETQGTPLHAAGCGDHFVVERVCDDDSAALRYLGSLNIRPGASLEIEGRAPFDGPLWVRTSGQSHALGEPLVRLIHGHVADGTQEVGR